jgi:hypothetical protein
VDGESWTREGAEMDPADWKPTHRLVITNPSGRRTYIARLVDDHYELPDGTKFSLRNGQWDTGLGILRPLKIEVEAANKPRVKYFVGDRQVSVEEFARTIPEVHRDNFAKTQEEAAKAARWQCPHHHVVPDVSIHRVPEATTRVEIDSFCCPLLEQLSGNAMKAL